MAKTIKIKKMTPKVVKLLEKNLLEKLLDFENFLERTAKIKLIWNYYMSYNEHEVDRIYKLTRKTVKFKKMTAKLVQLQKKMENVRMKKIVKILKMRRFV